uniref:Protein TIC 21, chloroplastic n=1 Tax=Brassica campestris TaxID=3711 RepID=M4FFG1_BRACM
MPSLHFPTASSSGVSAVALRPGFHHRLPARLSPSFNPLRLAPNPLISPKRRATTISSYQSPSSPLLHGFQIKGSKTSLAPFTVASSYPTSPGSVSGDSEVDKAKLAQVAKRLEKTSRYFKRLGSIGFWGQLVSTLVAAVILSFSVAVTGKPTSPATFYATASGIAAGFVSVFWSFGYIRLSERLRRTAADPAKVSVSAAASMRTVVVRFADAVADAAAYYIATAGFIGVNRRTRRSDAVFSRRMLTLPPAPPRADVVKGLRSGIMVNLVGMGAAILGMQATVGFLVAKALTTSASPFYQGVSQGYSPVLALDVFLASANTLLSHFLGLVCSLELLRSVTVPSSESIAVPKVA